MRFEEISTLLFASLMLHSVTGQGQSPLFDSFDPCRDTPTTRCELENLRFLQMRFLGGDCSQNKTEQSPLQFQCEDYGTISFEEEDIYIEVKGADGDGSIYYSNTIEQYQIVKLYDGEPVMSSDINITIYNTSSISPENILQTMQLSSDCDDGTRIFLGDIYGSLQLVGFSSGANIIQCNNYETPEPSTMPTTSPTKEPSITPTTSPTKEPSITPNISPTKEPSITPTILTPSPTKDSKKGKKGDEKSGKKTDAKNSKKGDEKPGKKTNSGDSKKGSKKQGKKMDKTAKGDKKKEPSKSDKKKESPKGDEKKESLKGDNDDDDDNSELTSSPTSPSKKSSTLSPTIVPQYDDDDDNDNSILTLSPISPSKKSSNLSPTSPSKKSSTLSPTIVPQYDNDDAGDDCPNTKKGCKQLKKKNVEKGYTMQEESPSN